MSLALVLEEYFIPSQYKLNASLTIAATNNVLDTLEHAASLTIKENLKVIVVIQNNEVTATITESKNEKGYLIIKRLGETRTYSNSETIKDQLDTIIDFVTDNNQEKETEKMSKIAEVLTSNKISSTDVDLANNIAYVTGNYAELMSKIPNMVVSGLSVEVTIDAITNPSNVSISIHEYHKGQLKVTRIAERRVTRIYSKRSTVTDVCIQLINTYFPDPIKEDSKKIKKTRKTTTKKSPAKNKKSTAKKSTAKKSTAKNPSKLKSMLTAFYHFIY